ncbi:MAG: YigZ family protein, partial [Erysipelotrichaceae bacterium]|nr:YigZ family protein [Erysipelotrichaceae bacterium]
STAGKPILEALKNRDLDNVLCVVVRYFGGTLLGTAGLIKAYGQCASLAADNAILTVPTEVLTCALTVDYSLNSRAEQLLQKHAEILDRQYGEKVTYVFSAVTDLNELIRNNVSYEAETALLKKEIRDMEIDRE